MQLKGRSVPLRRSAAPQINPRRVLFWLVLIVLFGALAWPRLSSVNGDVTQLMLPTPTTTRTPRSYAEEAVAHFSAGDLVRASLAFKLALELDPRNLTYWVDLARVQIYLEQYADALQSAENAVLLDPANVRARAIQAWALFYNERYDEARASAVQAIALDPNYAPAHAYYADILNSTQNWEQGTREAQTALRLDPTLVEAHRAMGFANESVGNYRGAVEHYKNALNFNPNLIPIYLRLGLNFRVLQDFDQAIFYFSKANTINPNNIQPYLALSRTYFQIDQLGTAEQYLQQALKIEPANPDIHGRLGLIYFKRKNYEGAEPSLRLAVEGGVYEYTEGRDTRQVTVTAMPLNARSLEYYYTLGNLLAFYRKCGPGEALFYLNQALNFAPDNRTVIGSYNESVALCRDTLNLTGTPTP